MLGDHYSESELGRMLLGAEEYHPFPTADERQPWEALPAELRQRGISEGERFLGFGWPALPAALYMDFVRTGDRSRFQAPYFERRSALGRLALAECIEGRGRFLDDISNGAWAICEESSWVIPAHVNPFGGTHPLPDIDDPYIDLFAAETAALLAWTHYLMRPRLDGITGRISARIRREVKSRLLDPFLRRDDFPWMGMADGRRLNNWSPWCASNCLVAFLLLEPEAHRRVRAVQKALRILNRFAAGYHSDGGCDEGPSYWRVAAGSLYDCLELLSGATQGRMSLFDDPLVAEMGRYIYRVHISGDYYVNFADCSARVHIPAGLVHRYGRRIGDNKMAALGAWAHDRLGLEAALGGSLLRVLPNLFCCQSLGEPAEPPYVRDVWLDGIQVMAAREREGADTGLYLAVKGGHNAESHNHNDVGQFVVYSDGQPVLIDVGVGAYTAKTFSKSRYDIWTMQSAYHNLPTVRGIQQRNGEEFRASDISYRADDCAAELSLDIARAYPTEAGVRSWRRTCRLVRGADSRAEVVDEFIVEPGTQDISLSLMTGCAAEMAGTAAIRLRTQGHTLLLTFDGAVLHRVDTIPLDDAHLRSAWGERLYRILLKPRAACARGRWVTRVARA